MSTRSYIAKKHLKDDTFTAIYCHFDGYLEGVGQTLIKSFTDEDKIDELLELGSLSYLGSDIEPENAFDGSNLDKSVTIAYHRDRGEPLNMNHFDNLEDLLDFFGESWGEYLYVFEDNKWLVKNNDNDYFMEVKEALNDNN